MVNITLRMRQTQEWKRTNSNSIQSKDPYHIPGLYNSTDTKFQEKEIELRLENLTGYDESDLEKLINKCRWKMFESLNPRPEPEAIPISAKPISETRLLPVKTYSSLKY